MGIGGENCRSGVATGSGRELAEGRQKRRDANWVPQRKKKMKIYLTSCRVFQLIRAGFTVGIVRL
jgi:hypothetical protein